MNINSSGDCRNPCEEENPCSTNAECVPYDHLAHCRCPIGYTGDPYEPGSGCSPIPPPECVEDKDCSVGLLCLEEKCRDPCREYQPCARNPGSEYFKILKNIHCKFSAIPHILLKKIFIIDLNIF